MNTAHKPKADFDQRYQTHLQHLKLKGLQPKTIDAYARGIRRMGDYFDHDIDDLSSAQADALGPRTVKCAVLEPKKCALWRGTVAMTV